jgi:hypothetical protein
VGGEEGARKVKMYARSHSYFSLTHHSEEKNAPSSFLHTENNNQIQLVKGSSSEHCHELQVPQKLGNFFNHFSKDWLEKCCLLGHDATWSCTCI